MNGTNLVVDNFPEICPRTRKNLRSYFAHKKQLQEGSSPPVLVKFPSEIQECFPHRAQVTNLLSIAINLNVIVTPFIIRSFIHQQHSYPVPCNLVLEKGDIFT